MRWVGDVAERLGEEVADAGVGGRDLLEGGRDFELRGDSMFFQGEWTVVVVVVAMV